MWIFGYGSLIWKVDFPFEERVVGCVKGYCRRFYQHSTDHRGTQAKPGRVVTLIKAGPDDEVWGVAYKISEQDQERVINELDYREKGGYRRHQVLFFPLVFEDKPFEITLYVATGDNKQYAGEASISSIALQVVEANGPSGSNVEYVFNLASAMRQIAPQIYDEHLYELEEKIIQILESRKLENLEPEDETNVVVHASSLLNDFSAQK